MERALFIHKFRNIGLNHDEKIVLNGSLNEQVLGGLICLIGPNNSGKSNVIDALLHFANQKIEERDITTLSFDEEDRKPSLRLVCRDGNDEYEYKISFNGTPYCNYPSKIQTPKFTFTSDLNTLKTITDFILTTAPRFGSDMLRYRALIHQITENNDTLKNIEDKTIELMNKIINRHQNFWNYIKSEFPNAILINECIQFIENNIDHQKNLFNDFQNKYGYSFLPEIIKYKEKVISNNLLSCLPDKITSNEFFMNLFEKNGIHIKDVINAYNDYKKFNSRGLLSNLEKEINKKLKPISDDFNKLYYTDNNYSFKLTLESEKIFFEINKEDKALNLDYQSTGFRWFFNLYFNLLCKNSLNPGDILMMDEPATNLHVKGQIELRNFLKEFAINNKIIIIIATHSPFLIDLDNLDELRIISNSNNETKIVNDFSTIDLEDPDCLKPIKESLTIDRHIIYDPNNTVVFVEGITDYNYLIAMKKKLNIADNIIFLPIKGVGKSKSHDFKKKQEEISKELIKLKKINPILLVDGDFAGKEIQKFNKNNDSALNVITLSDIDSNFIEIESLFTEKDLINLNIKTANNKQINKSSLASSIIKNHIEEYTFEEATLENFKKVFDTLVNY